MGKLGDNVALKRLCRCNKIFNYSDKLCPDCTAIAENEKSERNRL